VWQLIPMGHDEVERHHEVPRAVVVDAVDGGAASHDLAGVEGHPSWHHETRACDPTTGAQDTERDGQCLGNPGRLHDDVDAGVRDRPHPCHEGVDPQRPGV
jgi:hypothetical protein